MIPLAKKGTLYFGGLGKPSKRDLPDWYQDARGVDSDQVLTFLDVISTKLQEAKSAVVGVANPYDNANDSYYESVEENLTSRPEKTDDYDEAHPQSFDLVGSWQAIIDPNRARRAAAGEAISFVWNVPTDSYTIIPPVEIYTPLLNAISERGLQNDVFGEVRVRDWGGDVTMTLVFESKQTQDIPGADEHPIYMGFETGYDYRARRAVYARPFGLDAYGASSLWAIGDKHRHSRRHVGSATDSEHEREHGRIPIQEWWDYVLDLVDVFCDEFAHDIQRAADIGIQFPDDEDLANEECELIPKDQLGDIDRKKPYTITDFISLLDYPGYIAEAAGDRLSNVAKASSTPTVFEIYRTLACALEQEYRGDSGRRLEMFGERSVSFLRAPERYVRIADNQYNHELEERDEQDDQDELVNGHSGSQDGSSLYGGSGSSRTLETRLERDVRRVGEVRRRQQSLSEIAGDIGE